MINKKIAVLLWFLLVAVSDLFSVSAGTEIFPMLKIYPFSYNAGLGCVNGVLSSQSLLNNPAVSSWMTEKELTISHMVYLEGIGYSYLSYNSPSEEKSCFAQIGYLGSGDITRTVYDPSPSNTLGYLETGNFNCSDIVLNAGCSKKINYDLSAGLSLRMINETLDNTNNIGLMLNLSLFYIPQYSDLTFSCGLFNLGPQVKNYDLPAGGFFCITRQVHPELLWAGEVCAYAKSGVELKTGFDYLLTDVLSLRSGYRHFLNDPGLGKTPDFNLNFGFGLLLDNYSFDYAWVPYGDLGQAHTISFSYMFGQKIIINTRAKPVKAESTLTIKNPKKGSLAVLNFSGKNISDMDTVYISDMIRDELDNNNYYSIISKGLMNNIFIRNAVTEDSCSTADCAANLGKILDVELVLAGSVYKLLNSYHIIVDLIDVRSGKVIKNLVADEQDYKKLKDTCWILAQRLVD